MILATMVLSAKSIRRYGFVMNDIGEAGDSAIWTIPTNSFYENVFSIGVQSDTVVAKNGLKADYYHVVGDSVVWIGNESRLSKMRVLSGEPVLFERHITIGDSIYGTYTGRGVYCEWLHAGVRGEFSTVADGRGDIVVGGDTIYNVIRIHHLRVYVQVVDKDTVNISRFIADDYTVNNDSDFILEDFYYWFDEIRCHPIMEARKLKNKDSYRAFIDASIIDDENEAVVQQHFREKTDDNADFPANVTAVIGIDRKSIDLKFDVADPCYVRLIVYDIIGRQLSGEKAFELTGGLQQETIALAEYPYGEILICLWTDDDISTVIKIKR